MTHDRYDNPLISRYSSPEMAGLWSEQRKFGLWRRLWVILAEAEKEMGLPIKEEQIQELAAHVDDIDFKRATAYEQKLRHDVMAHVHTYGDACPNAKPIIHLGATSCYVTDNADLVLMREGLALLARRIAVVVDQLGKFAKDNRDLACLAFTHLQPAQPTTVGRRACLWAYDLALDLAEIEHRIGALKARSVKGTTGTQASFLALFHGDHAKVRKLEQLIAEKLGFGESYAVTGQTYSRKIDSQVLDVLSGIAQSGHKMATDLRILASRKEIEEPFEADQIGSSAMAYKRKSDAVRACLQLVAVHHEPANEHTDDRCRPVDGADARRQRQPPAGDSAGVSGGRCRAALASEYHRGTGRLSASDHGQPERRAALHGDGKHPHGRGSCRRRPSQDLHERIRRHSQEAARRVKQDGYSNDLLDRLQSDKAFEGVNIAAATDPKEFVGRAPQQVDEFLAEIVQPIRDRYPGSVSGGLSAEVKV